MEEELKDWELIALRLKQQAEVNSIQITEIANRTGLHRMTITRFFNLNFCLRLDHVISIAKALDLEIEIK